MPSKVSLLKLRLAAAALLAVLALLALAPSGASALQLGLGFQSIEGSEKQMYEIDQTGTEIWRIQVEQRLDTGETYDRIFGEAARYGITVLPIVRTEPATKLVTSEAEKNSFGSWLSSVVKRYGYNGSFWASHPAIPAKPATAWEFLNEPNLSGENYIAPKQYGELLAWAGPIIQGASQAQAGRSTEVLFGGLELWGVRNAYEKAQIYLREAYNVSGVANAITGVAIHPYELEGSSFSGYSPIEAFRIAVGGIRSQLDTPSQMPGGSNENLWITEVGWPTGGPNFSVTEAVQADLLKQSFQYARNNAATLKLQAIVWYNYADVTRSPDHWDGHCGIRQVDLTPKQAWYAFQEEAGVPVGPPKPEPAPPKVIQGEDDNFPGPHAIGQTDGTMDVFYRTSHDKLGHAIHGSSGPWSATVLEQATLDSSAVPHSIVQSNGTIDVFYRTPEKKLGHAWYGKGGGGWSVGSIAGTAKSDPHAVFQPDGTIDVFYRTSDDALGHDWYGTSGGGWTGNSLTGAGTVGSDPYGVVQPDGTIDVFWRTPTGALGHAWKGSGGGAPWASVPLQETSIAAGSVPHPLLQENGTIDVFWRTPANELGHAWKGAGSGTWGVGGLAGATAGKLASEPHAVAKKDGTIDVVFKNSVGALGHHWYAPCCGGWANNTLSGSGALASDPHPVIQENGTIDVFWRNPSNGIGHAWAGSSGGWGLGTIAGTTTSVPHAIAQPNGTIDVFYRTPAGALGHDWYASSCCGGWGSNVDLLTPNGVVALEPPRAITGLATSVGTSTATLNGTVNPEGSATTYFFEYGTSTAYTLKAPTTPLEAGSGTANVAVSRALTGLSGKTTYHYRLVATSSAGGTTYGEDRTFTTG
jgi:hypothetical protein